MCTWTQKQKKHKLFEYGKAECLEKLKSSISVDKNDTAGKSGLWSDCGFKLKFKRLFIR